MLVLKLILLLSLFEELECCRSSCWFIPKLSILITLSSSLSCSCQLPIGIVCCDGFGMDKLLLRGGIDMCNSCYSIGIVLCPGQCIRVLSLSHSLLRHTVGIFIFLAMLPHSLLSSAIIRTNALWRIRFHISSNSRSCISLLLHVAIKVRSWFWVRILNALLLKLAETGFDLINNGLFGFCISSLVLPLHDTLIKDLSLQHLPGGWWRLQPAYEVWFPNVQKMTCLCDASNRYTVFILSIIIWMHDVVFTNHFDWWQIRNSVMLHLFCIILIEELVL